MFSSWGSRATYRSSWVRQALHAVEPSRPGFDSGAGIGGGVSHVVPFSFGQALAALQLIQAAAPLPAQGNRVPIAGRVGDPQGHARQNDFRFSDIGEVFAIGRKG